MDSNCQTKRCCSECKPSPASFKYLHIERHICQNLPIDISCVTFIITNKSRSQITPPWEMAVKQAKLASVSEKVYKVTYRD